MRPEPPMISFASITPALWEQLVPQALQDRYTIASWRARVYLRTHGLIPSLRRRRARRPQLVSCP